MSQQVSYFTRAALALFFGVSVLHAHPMGNFSVNHYARIEVGQPSTNVLFVLDLAELPSFELMQRWGLQAQSPHAELERKAIAEARVWTRQLQFTANGKRITPVFERGEFVMTDGAGGLPVMRISSHLKLAAEPGTLEYADKTYPDRTAGWKEVVVVTRGAAALGKSSAGSTERSGGLAAYPQDPAVSPPQDLTASVEWKGAPGAVPVTVSEAVKPVEPPVAPAASVTVAPTVAAQPAAALPAGKTGATVAEPNAMGQVRRGDFLSQTLQGKEIGWGLGLICVAVSFWFGALHALEPGHGKTMVAAYLVGERGTPRHAILLGGMVTFTHTVSVFILGLLTMFLSQYIMPDVISKWLGVISGLTIVWIGGLLLYRRAKSLAGVVGHSHGHSHSHDHGHAHVHAAEENAHLQAAEPHSHTHDGVHFHTHEPAAAVAQTHSHETHSHSHGDGNSHTHEPVPAVAHTHSHEPHSHSHDGVHFHTHEPVAALAQTHSHSHGDGHSHTREPAPAVAHTHSHVKAAHSHSHDHGHSHSHGGLTHTHDGHTHSHVVEGEISMKSLIALGASGGLVPCPSALVLLLAAVSVGRTGFGLLLLVSFSLGLALVLMATGLAVLYAKRFFPERKDRKASPFFRIMPVVSAAVIFLIGVVLTGNALGLIPVIRFFG